MLPSLLAVLLLLLLANAASGAVDCSKAGLGDGNCADLSRETCGAIANVCGPCLRGYEGPAGDSNTVCTAISCGFVPTNQVGIPPSASDTALVYYGQEIQYTCPPGYETADGRDMYLLRCGADGKFVRVGDACVNMDSCAGNPCGELECEDLPAPSQSYRCKCPAGAECGEATIESDQGYVHIRANDVLISHPSQKNGLSISGIWQEIQESQADIKSGSARTSALEGSLSRQVAALMANITALPTYADVNGEAARATAAESALSARISALSSSIDRLASNSQVQMTQLGDEIDDVRDLVLSLADSHTDLSDAHNITKTMATQLSLALDIEKSTARAAEQSLSTAVSSIRVGGTNVDPGQNTRIQALEDALKNMTLSNAESLKNITSTFTAQIAALDRKIQLLTLAESCKRIKELNPSAASGEYQIRPLGFPQGQSLTVYCEMSVNGGGWTRVTFIDESACGLNCPCVEQDTAYIEHANLRHKSFAGVWFKNQKPQELLIHNLVGQTDPTPSSFGYNHYIRIFWGTNPFTLYNYNNHPIALCENLTTGTKFTGCLYASHTGSPWQQCAFSFSVNNVGNAYSGLPESRLTLGPTSQPGQACYWHNLGANTIPKSVDNSFVYAPNKKAYMYMR